jgi:hypothetical protein
MAKNPTNTDTNTNPSKGEEGKSNQGPSVDPNTPIEEGKMEQSNMVNATTGDTGDNTASVQQREEPPVLMGPQAAPTQAPPAAPTLAFPITDNQVAELMKLPTKSARIRSLAAQGYTNTQITKSFKDRLGDEILYQHVRNVLNQVVKRPIGQIPVTVVPHTAAPKILIRTVDENNNILSEQLVDPSEVVSNDQQGGGEQGNEGEGTDGEQGNSRQAA